MFWIASTNKQQPLKERVMNNKTPRSLPPYGKEAAVLLSYGFTPRNDIYIFTGKHCWKKAQAFKDRQVVMCLPIGNDPFNYDWPVCNCSVLIVDTGNQQAAQIEKFAYCLLCAKASVVWALLSNHKLIVYGRDSA